MNQDTEWYGDRPPRETSSSDDDTHGQRPQLLEPQGELFERRSQSVQSVRTSSPPGLRYRSASDDRYRYDEQWRHSDRGPGDPTAHPFPARMEDAHPSPWGSAHRPSYREDGQPLFVAEVPQPYQRGYFTTQHFERSRPRFRSSRSEPLSSDQAFASSSSSTVSRDQREPQVAGSREASRSRLIDTVRHNPDMPPSLPLVDTSIPPPPLPVDRPMPPPPLPVDRPIPPPPPPVDRPMPPPPLPVDRPIPPPPPPVDRPMPPPPLPVDRPIPPPPPPVDRPMPPPPLPVDQPVPPPPPPVDRPMPPPPPPVDRPIPPPPPPVDRPMPPPPLPVDRPMPPPRLPVKRWMRPPSLPLFNPNQPPPGFMSPAKRHERNIFESLSAPPPPPPFEVNITERGDIQTHPLRPDQQALPTTTTRPVTQAEVSEVRDSQSHPDSQCQSAVEQRSDSQTETVGRKATAQVDPPTQPGPSRPQESERQKVTEPPVVTIDLVEVPPRRWGVLKAGTIIDLTVDDDSPEASGSRSQTRRHSSAQAAPNLPPSAQMPVPQPPTVPPTPIFNSQSQQYPIAAEMEQTQRAGRFVYSPEPPTRQFYDPPFSYPHYGPPWQWHSDQRRTFRQLPHVGLGDLPYPHGGYPRQWSSDQQGWRGAWQQGPLPSTSRQMPPLPSPQAAPAEFAFPQQSRWSGHRQPEPTASCSWQRSPPPQGVYPMEFPFLEGRSQSDQQRRMSVLWQPEPTPSCSWQPSPPPQAAYEMEFPSPELQSQSNQQRRSENWQPEPVPSCSRYPTPPPQPDFSAPLPYRRNQTSRMNAFEQTLKRLEVPACSDAKDMLKSIKDKAQKVLLNMVNLSYTRDDFINAIRFFTMLIKVNFERLETPPEGFSAKILVASYMTSVLYVMLNMFPRMGFEGSELINYLNHMAEMMTVYLQLLVAYCVDEAERRNDISIRLIATDAVYFLSTCLLHRFDYIALCILKARPIAGYHLVEKFWLFIFWQFLKMTEYVSPRPEDMYRFFVLHEVFKQIFASRPTVINGMQKFINNRYGPIEQWKQRNALIKRLLEKKEEISCYVERELITDYLKWWEEHKLCPGASPLVGIFGTYSPRPMEGFWRRDSSTVSESDEEGNMFSRRFYTSRFDFGVEEVEVARKPFFGVRFRSTCQSTADDHEEPFLLFLNDYDEAFSAGSTELSAQSENKASTSQTAENVSKKDTSSQADTMDVDTTAREVVESHQEPSIAEQNPIVDPAPQAATVEKSPEKADKSADQETIDDQSAITRKTTESQLVTDLETTEHITTTLLAEVDAIQPGPASSDRKIEDSELKSSNDMSKKLSAENDQDEVSGSGKSSKSDECIELTEDVGLDQPAVSSENSDISERKSVKGESPMSTESICVDPASNRESISPEKTDDQSSISDHAEIEAVSEESSKSDERIELTEDVGLDQPAVSSENSDISEKESVKGESPMSTESICVDPASNRESISPEKTDDQISTSDLAEIEAVSEESSKSDERIELTEDVGLDQPAVSSENSDISEKESVKGESPMSTESICVDPASNRESISPEKTDDQISTSDLAEIEAVSEESSKSDERIELTEDVGLDQPAVSSENGDISERESMKGESPMSTESICVDPASNRESISPEKTDDQSSISDHAEIEAVSEESSKSDERIELTENVGLNQPAVSSENSDISEKESVKGESPMSTDESTCVGSASNRESISPEKTDDQISTSDLAEIEAVSEESSKSDERIELTEDVGSDQPAVSSENSDISEKESVKGESPMSTESICVDPASNRESISPEKTDDQTSTSDLAEIEAVSEQSSKSDERIELTEDVGSDQSAVSSENSDISEKETVKGESPMSTESICVDPASNRESISPEKTDDQSSISDLAEVEAVSEESSKSDERIELTEDVGSDQPAVSSENSDISEKESVKGESPMSTESICVDPASNRESISPEKTDDQTSTSDLAEIEAVSEESSKSDERIELTEDVGSDQPAVSSENSNISEKETVKGESPMSTESICVDPASNRESISPEKTDDQSSISDLAEIEAVSEESSKSDERVEPRVDLILDQPAVSSEKSEVSEMESIEGESPKSPENVCVDTTSNQESVSPEKTDDQMSNSELAEMEAAFDESLKSVENIDLCLVPATLSPGNSDIAEKESAKCESPNSAENLVERMCVDPISDQASILPEKNYEEITELKLAEIEPVKGESSKSAETSKSTVYQTLDQATTSHGEGVETSSHSEVANKESVEGDPTSAESVCVAQATNSPEKTDEKIADLKLKKTAEIEAVKSGADQATTSHERTDEEIVDSELLQMKSVEGEISTKSTESSESGAISISEAAAILPASTDEELAEVAVKGECSKSAGSSESGVISISQQAAISPVKPDEEIADSKPAEIKAVKSESPKLAENIKSNVDMILDQATVSPGKSDKGSTHLELAEKEAVIEKSPESSEIISPRPDTTGISPEKSDDAVAPIERAEKEAIKSICTESSKIIPSRTDNIPTSPEKTDEATSHLVAAEKKAVEGESSTLTESFVQSVNPILEQAAVLPENRGEASSQSEVPEHEAVKEESSKTIVKMYKCQPSKMDDGMPLVYFVGEGESEEEAVPVRETVIPEKELDKSDNLESAITPCVDPVLEPAASSPEKPDEVTAQLEVAEKESVQAESSETSQKVPQSEKPSRKREKALMTPSSSVNVTPKRVRRKPQVATPTKTPKRGVPATIVAGQRRVRGQAKSKTVPEVTSPSLVQGSTADTTMSEEPVASKSRKRPSVVHAEKKKSKEPVASTSRKRRSVVHAEKKKLKEPVASTSRKRPSVEHAEMKTEDVELQEKRKKTESESPAEENIQKDNCVTEVLQLSDELSSGNKFLVRQSCELFEELTDIELNNKSVIEAQSGGDDCSTLSTSFTEEDRTETSDSSLSLAQLPYEKLNKKKVQKYFNRKRRQFETSGTCSSDAGNLTRPEPIAYKSHPLTNPNTDSSTWSSLTASTSSLVTSSYLSSSASSLSSDSFERSLSVRDPRLSGQSEVAKRYRQSCEAKPACGVALEWRESFDDSTVIYNEKFGEEKSEAQAEKQTVSEAVASPKPTATSCLDFYNSFGREVSVDVLDETEVSQNDLVNLASPNTEDETITINLRHILINLKQEPIEEEPTQMVAEGTGFLTPEWDFDQPTQAGYGNFNIPVTARSTSQNLAKNPHLIENLIAIKPEEVPPLQHQPAVVFRPVSNPPVNVKENHQMAKVNPETGPLPTRSHAVSFFEQRAGEIYAREFGQPDNALAYRANTKKYSWKDAAVSSLGPYHRPKTPAPSKSKVLHVTAEDNELFQNAFEGPVVKSNRGFENEFSKLLWNSSGAEPLNGQATASVKVQAAPIPVANSKENLVSILKKSKSRGDNKRKRIQFESPNTVETPLVDPNLSKLVIKLKRCDMAESLIKEFKKQKQRERQQQLKQLRYQRDMIAAHERAVMRAYEMEAKERQLSQKSGAVCCLFDVTRKNQRFSEGNTDDRRNGNHRFGDRLPQKRKLDDQPAISQRKKAKIDVIFKDQTYSEQCRLASKSGLYIAMDVMVDDQQSEKRISKQALKPLAIPEALPTASSPTVVTKSGRRKRKPVGKDYLDVTKRRIPALKL